MHFEAGKPLTFRKIDVQKIGPGHSFIFRVWLGEDIRYTLSVEAGGGDIDAGWWRDLLVRSCSC
jgi:hypothetical protein